MILALKFNNNDYYPIVSEYLDILDKDDNITTLEGIDLFTSKYTKEEIIDSIRRSNIIANSEVLNNCELVITYCENKKIREYKVYTKDDIDYLKFDTIDFLFRNISNKNILNRLNNYFSNKSYLPEDLSSFANILNEISIGQLINCYMNLGYRSKRILKNYIFTEILPKTESKVLKRDNKEIL